MSATDAAARALADLALAARVGEATVLSFGTIVSVDGNRVYVRPDGAPEGTVIGPIPLVGSASAPPVS